MPEIDLDALSEILPPWDLTIKVARKSYRVRPLSLLDLGKIAQIETGSITSAVATVENLFEDPKPSLGNLDAPRIMAVVGAITLYAKAIAKKNSPLLIEAVQAAMQESPGAGPGVRSGSSPVP